MSFGYSFNVWVPLLAFPTSGPYGATRWQRGWPITFTFYFLLWAGFITAVLLHRRDKKLKRQQATLTETLSSAEASSREAVPVYVVVDKKLTS